MILFLLGGVMLKALGGSGVLDVFDFGGVGEVFRGFVDFGV
jgi:hypothetical protein